MSKKNKPITIQAEETHDLEGVTKTVEDWSKDPACVVTINLIYSRLAKGWSIRQAFSICMLKEEEI